MVREYLITRLHNIRRLIHNTMQAPVYQLLVGFLFGVMLGGHTGLLFLLAVIVLVSSKLRFGLLVLGVCVGMARFDVYFGPVATANTKQSYGAEFAGKVEILSVERVGAVNYEARVASHLFPGDALLKINSVDEIYAGMMVEVVSGVLEEPPSFDGFSYAEFLSTQGVNYILSSHHYNLLSSKVSPPIPSKIKRLFGGFINRSMAEPAAGLLTGILIGNKGLDPNVEENMRITGTSHITSVSGYNVSVILVALMGLAGLVDRRLLAIFGGLGLVLFIQIVGWDNLPARRAVLMGWILVISWLTGRKGVIYTGLLITIAYMLWENPLVWKNISFQLSVSAMLGILLTGNKFAEAFKFLPKWLSSNMLPTLAAMLATLPITMPAFGTFSLVAVPVNVMVLPLVPLAMLLGALGVLVGVIGLDPISRMLMWLTEVILDLIIWLVQQISQFSWAQTDELIIGWGVFLVLVIVVFYVDYVSFLKLRRGRK